jgi:hypothetical protein
VRACKNGLKESSGRARCFHVHPHKNPGSDIPIAAGPTAALATAFRNRPRQCAQKGAIGIIVQQAITSQRLRF